MSFDLHGPLPQGTVVLEASAGTGKTYAIAALVTRYVAEGAELSGLLLATFGRAATSELRERTRERLSGAATALAGAAGTGEDALVAGLRRGTASEVRLRRERLVRAVAEFDAATIVTTHSFCQQMLDGLGLSGGSEPGARLVESTGELLREVVEDLYLRKYAAPDAPTPGFSVEQAWRIARDATGDRQARLEPADADPASDAGQRVGFARAVRVEFDHRKRAASVRDYDDLLTRLRDVLADPATGPAACARLQERFAVVLVDEFQDTDPVQWEVLRRAFHGHRTLVLIGDPKQAVYAFRGAEVLSYLDAVENASVRQSLPTNHRSDPELLSALQHLYGGAALGHPDIVVPPVRAHRLTGRLTGAPPLRLRVLDRTGSGPPGVAGLPGLPAVRGRVARAVADDVAGLLAGPARLELGGAVRPVRPGDIAVLVRTGLQSRLVEQALRAAGVPAVVSSAQSVFGTTSATDWLHLLQAMQQPHRTGLVRRAALTPLIGWTAEQVAAAADAAAGVPGADPAAGAELDAVVGLLREAAGVLERVGLSAAFELLGARTHLQRRLLSVTSGERRLTDLRHLAQVLQRAAVERSFGLGALTDWLAARVAEPESGELYERSRRLDSDAAAVQVLTVHASKGLEYPVVHLPYGWDRSTLYQPVTWQLHDGEGARLLDVGGPGGADHARRRKAADAESDDQELRLLYVAATRAMCQVVLWWAPATTTALSPLHRLLLGRVAGSATVPGRVVVPEDAPALARLTAWAGSRPDVVVESGAADQRVAAPAEPALPLSPPPGTTSPSPMTDVVTGLDVARFDRSIDSTWKRTSYSALTAAAHDAAGAAGPRTALEPVGGSEPEQPELEDEPARLLPDVVADGPASTMNALPSGAAFGTLVHLVLEQVDTSAPDLAAELLLRCRAAVASRLAAIDPVALADALLPVLRTPLAVPTDSTLSLADIGPGDRLVELVFELPLAGGDDPTGLPPRLSHVAALLRRHLPADDPLSAYPDRLDELAGTPLNGYLNGSVDAVLRTAGPSYTVVDYKTNRLGRGDLTATHYTQAAMATEMVRAHYPLQALLYCVALHRYLRWRQPGYEPALHLGGVHYLFVRGMVGPATPPGCGVFAWRPPPALVVELSDLLAGRP